MCDMSEALREHYAEKDREYWDSFNDVYEVRDERQQNVEDQIAAVCKFMLECMAAGATETVAKFLMECRDAAAKQESLDDVAWDYYQDHWKEIEE